MLFGGTAAAWPTLLVALEFPISLEFNFERISRGRHCPRRNRAANESASLEEIHSWQILLPRRSSFDDLGCRPCGIQAPDQVYKLVC